MKTADYIIITAVIVFGAAAFASLNYLPRGWFWG